MRHNASARKLGRKTGHRIAMFRNQLSSLVAQERIVTTLAKAKELRPLAERIVTQGKRDSVHARRLVGRWIQNRDLIKKLFDEISPRFSTRPGGYLRIVKLGSRHGDGAELAVLEFVDFVHKKTEKASSDETKGKKAKGADEGAAPEAAEEKPAKKSAKPAAAKVKKAPAAKSVAKKEPKVDAKPKTRTPKAPAAARKSSAPKKSGGS